MLLVFVILKVHAQYFVNFESSYNLHLISKDTIGDTNNIWQIGTPQKAVLNSAYSPDKVIITDTVNSYPNNDTSRFNYVYASTCTGCYGHIRQFQGYYYVDTDSINDFGTIEFSPDNGNTWIDLINDEYYANLGCYNWLSEKPVLTGSSCQWKYFSVDVQGFWIYFDIWEGDTTLFRFKFVSDNQQTERGGIMFDNLDFFDMQTCSVNEYQFNNISSKAYPNPGSSKIIIEFKNLKNEEFVLQVYSSKGERVYLKERINTDQIVLLNLTSGIYTYRLVSLKGRKISNGKLVVKG